MERINAWNTYSGAEEALVFEKAERYRTFLNRSKTERECAAELVRMARAAGFTELERAEKLQPGERVYTVCMNKAVQLFIVGRRPLAQGLNILGAHIDSPRLDVKQNPLYEEGDLAYLDTHYYGNIKKYQWLTLPLSLHGVVVKKDGTAIDVVIGEQETDPVVGISDLMPNLASQQLDKKASAFIDGEALNVIVGGKPLSQCEREPVKAAILCLLKERYGMAEEDFLSAELEIVPAGACRDFGLDRSMLLGYGHDDRVCAFAQADAIFGIEGVPETTCCAIWADKEEIGSVGATGMRARYFENAVAELMERCGQYGELALRRCLAASRMLSCDVSVGFDPLFASAFEKKNTAYLGRGVCFSKFTGAKGKSNSNDANAEYMGRLRKLMEDGSVNYQTAEFGRVDAGGGGTIAYICALYGMEVIDSGVAVLSMHAPWEIISKADLYEAAKAYRVFLLHA